MGMILDGTELPVCCGVGFRIFPYNGDVIITCDSNPCNKSKTLNNLKDGILWEDCEYCGGDLYEETKKSTKELPDDVEDLTVCEGCWEKHYAQFEAEDQSAYWFLKGEMQSRAPLNEMDLEQIMEMLQNVPKKEMNEAIEQAEMMGDEAAMIVLVMADNKRKFREEYASEDEPSVEKYTNFFAGLKAQNPDLARKIEFSVKNYDDLPRKEIESAGFDYDKIEEWVDLVGVEDENLQGYESCSNCEGEGYVLTSYTSATRFDPADGDGEDCEECGGTGMIDPSDYMDKEGQYYAESWLTEGKCAICNSPSKFTVMTAIGERSFCCEACYADYVGLPVEEEGYYGLASEYKAEETEMDRAKIILDNIIKDVWREFNMGSRWRYTKEDWLDAKVLENDGTPTGWLQTPQRKEYYKKSYPIRDSDLPYEEYEDDNDVGYTWSPTELAFEMVENYQDKLRKRYGNHSIKLELEEEAWNPSARLYMKISIGKETMEQNQAAETKISKTCPNCEKYGRDATTDYICDMCAQCKGCCKTSYGCYDVAICNDCDGSFIGKDIDGCCGSCDDCCECDQDPSMNAESKSMNSYLLGAGIFALTLGLLSRKR